MPPSPASSRSPRPVPGRRRALAGLALAGAAGASLSGLWIAKLTLELNPHLRGADAVLLLAELGGGYGLAGLAAGAGAALAAAIALRLGAPARRVLPPLVGILSLGPLLYAALLPQSGLSADLLSDLLFGSGAGRAAAAAGALAVLGGAGLAAERLLRHRLPAAARGFRTALAMLWSAGVLGIAGWALAGDPPAPPRDPAVAATSTVPDVAGGGAVPPRLVLLVSDGADLEVILALARRGELPAFSRLMEGGTWGPLATLEPTLSPVVWTTLATGKPPAEHGVRHFVSFRLPGLSRPVREFPLHAGLNFRLFPLIARLPGVPDPRVPVTSDLRRVEALWSIAGRFHPVGVYRWLVTWPPEPVNGFMVAGGFGWVQFVQGHAGETEAAAGSALHPPDLFRRLRRPPRPRVTPAMLRSYLGNGPELPAGDPRPAAVRSFLADPTSRLLPRLIRAFDARFTAAAFYNVDPFHHYFAAHRGTSGRFSGAVDAAYRHLDARLGDLLDALEAEGEPFHLILVSDHGFDFRHRHHTWAPPGIFFARGPAFPPGRRVAGLSIYDVAPLALHVLHLPLPEDMPGSLSGAYRQALDAGWLDAHPAVRVPTYEDGGPTRPLRPPPPHPAEDRIREVLKSLGYLG